MEFYVLHKKPYFSFLLKLYDKKNTLLMVQHIAK